MIGDLQKKQAKFALAVAKLIQQANLLGFEVTLGEAYRTPEQSALNAQHGSGIANSLHTKRLAIDLLLFKNGEWLQKSEDYTPLGEWWEAQSTPEFICAWGGRFTQPDGNHFSATHNGVR